MRAHPQLLIQIQRCGKYGVSREENLSLGIIFNTGSGAVADSQACQDMAEDDYSCAIYKLDHALTLDHCLANHEFTKTVLLNRAKCHRELGNYMQVICF